MHKFHQRSLPQDQAGIILKTCCNSTGVIQTVCLFKDRSSRRGDLYLVPRSILENYILYFPSKTYVKGAQKNGLNETVLLSTQNTFKLMGKKTIKFYANKISLSGSMPMVIGLKQCFLLSVKDKLFV